jgi:hypothetical protein
MAASVDQWRSMAINSGRSSLKVGGKSALQSASLNWIHKNVKRAAPFHLAAGEQRRVAGLFQKVNGWKRTLSERRACKTGSPMSEMGW